MTYPRVSAKHAREIRDVLFDALDQGEPPNEVEDRTFGELETKYVDFIESSNPVSGDFLYERSSADRSDLIASGNLDLYRANGSDSRENYLEELMASRIHAALDNLDPGAIHDAGFWRYLALFPYRWFLFQREGSMQSHDYGGAEGQREKWLMIRCYQWGRKCFDATKQDPYQRAFAVRQAKRRLGVTEGYTIDFYHSHIVRPRWADTPTVAGAFIDSVTTAPEATDTGQDVRKRPVAQLAKGIARLSNNVCLAYLDEAEIQGLIDKEKLKVLAKNYG